VKRIGLILFLLAALPARPAIFSTIVTNGPATNCVNLVFFSEGYTNGQLGKFLSDATNAASAFFNVQPYAEYSNYFNVFAIFTNSAHAGSTHLIESSYVVGYTYFNSTYDASSDYIITIPPDVSDGNSSHGRGKINALLWTNYVSVLRNTNNNLPALLINDGVPGGSDGGASDYGKTAITSVPNVSYFLVHESGHVLGALGDEYTTAYPGYPTNDVEPNTTTNTVYSKIKWNAWVSTNTPIPTPATFTYEYTVGLFEGAHYHTTNWYRPYYDCCMRSFGDANFCPVCQEALVLAIYGKVRPVENRSPATNSLTVTNPQSLTFSLNLLQPSTHDLNVQWLTNSAAVGGATNPVFNLWPTQLGNGTNKVEADVWDATALVRTDSKNLLKQTNVWTLKVSVPVMQIDTLTWLTNGSFSFRVTGSAPAAVVVQLSTNLLQWTPVQTSSFNSGKFFYTNAGAKSFPKRFFRTKTPP
jgi:hypothetical protein